MIWSNEGTKLRKISKNVFLNSIVCSKLGWLMRRRQVTQEPTLGEMFRIEEGKEIGERARTLHSNGVLVDDRNLNSAVIRTEALINDQKLAELEKLIRETIEQKNSDKLEIGNLAGCLKSMEKERGWKWVLTQCHLLNFLGHLCFLQSYVSL